MRITSRIKWNIDTWEVVEEEWFEYDGPLALCQDDDDDDDGGTGGDDPGGEEGDDDDDDDDDSDDTDEERWWDREESEEDAEGDAAGIPGEAEWGGYEASPEVQEKIAELFALDPELYARDPSAFRKVMDEAGISPEVSAGLTSQLSKGAAQYERDVSAFRDSMSEFEQVNTDISFLHDISELSGGLSDEENAFLETIRSNATENLISTVNEATTELAGEEIARLVNRGVLQGNIGEAVLAKVYEKSGKLVAEQSRNIESDVAKMGLGISEQRKLNQLSLWDKELEAAMKSSELGITKAGQIGELELGGLALADKTGLEQARLTQDWEKDITGALTTMRGQDIAMMGKRGELELGALEAADKTGLMQTGQTQQWNQSLLQALTQMRGQDIGSLTARETARMQEAMASQEMGAWERAQNTSMFGNIASSLIGALLPW